MPTRYILVCAAVLLDSCAWPVKSEWHLMDSGYSIDAANTGEFEFNVHVNQLKQLGGEITTPQFRVFVAERLKWSGICETGWAPLPCVEDGSCVRRTSRSVTVPGRCVAP